MVTIEDLNAMSDRAQRHLDGMRVNRDAMARDLLRLVDALRAERAVHAGNARRDSSSGRPTPDDEPPRRHFTGETFEDALDKAFEAMDQVDGR